MDTQCKKCGEEMTLSSIVFPMDDIDMLKIEMKCMDCNDLYTLPVRFKKGISSEQKLIVVGKLLQEKNQKHFIERSKGAFG